MYYKSIEVNYVKHVIYYGKLSFWKKNIFINFTS